MAGIPGVLKLPAHRIGRSPSPASIVTGTAPPGRRPVLSRDDYVQDPALDARSLKVALQGGRRGVDPGTTRAIEDAILTRHASCASRTATSDPEPYRPRAVAPTAFIAEECMYWLNTLTLLLIICRRAELASRRLFNSTSSRHSSAGRTRAVADRLCPRRPVPYLADRSADPPVLGRARLGPGRHRRGNDAPSLDSALRLV